MMMAAALVKPFTTGWDRKFTTSPSRRMPRRKLKNPHHQGQQDGIGDIPFASGCGQGSERGGGHQGNHRHRAGGQLTAGPEQGGHHGGRKAA